MRKLLLILFLIMGSISVVQAENLTLTTYYPAPFGAYDRLRLIPRATIGAPCDIGTLYVETPDSLRICMDGGGGVGAWSDVGVWTQNGNNIYPVNTSSNPNIAVGIGTTTPDVRLEVIDAGSPTSGGSMACFTSGSGSIAGNLHGIEIDKDSVGSIMLGINKNTTTGNVPANSAYITTWGSAATLSIGRGGNNFRPNHADIFIGSTGNVGIGTTNPYKKFLVVDAGSATDGGEMAGFTSGSGSVAGNLHGIHVDKDGVEAVMLGINKNSTTGSVPSNSTYLSTWKSNGELSIGRGGSNNRPNYADIFVNDNGYIGINTTYPRKLFHVRKETQANADYSSYTQAIIEGKEASLQIIGADDTGFASSLILSMVPASGNSKHWNINAMGPTGNNNFEIEYLTSSGTWWPTTGNRYFTIGTNGNVGISDTSPSQRLEIGGGNVNTTGGGYMDNGGCVAGTCASDMRLKENVQPLSNSLEKIIQLQPIAFTFIDEKYGPTDKLQYGLSAQDTEKIFPSWVSIGEDGYRKLKYGLQIEMHLIQTTKELNAKIETLEKENTSLKEMFKETTEQQQKRIEALERKTNKL